MSRFRYVWAALLVALFVPAIASAQFKQGDWELTLGAQAAHGPDFNGVSAGGTGSIGYFFTNALEGAVRQSVQYSDLGAVAGGTSFNGSSWAGTTDIAVDYHFDLGRWQPFLGANIGYVYGDTHNTFIAGPEAGVKWFANDTTFIYGMVEYEFNFDNGSSSDSFSDGQFNYVVGIGFRF